MAVVHGQVRVAESEVQFEDDLDVMPLGAHWQATVNLKSAPEEEAVINRPVTIVTKDGEYPGRLTDYINMFSAGTLITIHGDGPVPH